MELKNIMKLENEDINLNFNLKFKKTQEYINKLKELNTGINLLLDEFKKNYIMAKMDPTNEDIQQLYQNTISNITQLQGNLFSMSNDIQININNINNKMFQLDGLIRYEKDKNNDLRKKLGIVENRNNSTLEMISDYRQIHETNYLRNWALFLSSIICMFTIRTVYNNPVV